jgi:hypothetical protein
MERVVFGVCLDSSDYERRCASHELPAHNRKETVFVFARLHRVVLLFQGPSPYRARGAKLRGLGTIATSYPSLDIVKSNSVPATSRRTPHASSLAHDKRLPLIPTPVFPFRRRCLGMLLDLFADFEFLDRSLQARIQNQQCFPSLAGVRGERQRPEFRPGPLGSIGSRLA